jgi:dTDP-4-amino-4,6-dideoxygalactose transaminase
MVDLKSQYQKIKGEIDVAIQGVIENAQFIKGPSVKEFEINVSNFLCEWHGCFANCDDGFGIETW